MHCEVTRRNNEHLYLY